MRTPALALLLLAPAVRAADPGNEFFENRVRPVLVEHCYGCHSADAKKLKGGLRLDTRDGVRTGGDSGPAVVPGKPAESLLIRSVEYSGDVTGMPPKGKLPAAVVADLRKWVETGAPDPRDGKALAGNGTWAETFAKRKDWWSLRPVTKPPIPSGNAANPIDRFLAAKRGAVPAAGPAERTTQLRRLTYALTGLPPTPDEIESFLADASPGAVGKAADRLLASPHYGERMAQHWMDVLRYAESHGSEGDPRIPGAWRFRDYLIRAFNADVRYDRLTRELIAGDLLPDPRPGESVIGPAHLRMVEHGFQPVDSLDEQAKTVDNQIDVISKAFLGLTVACARCHDHKFDAISQRDYTALYGILASARPAQVTVDSPNPDRLVALKADVKAGLVSLWLKEADAVPARLLDPPTHADTARLREALKAAEAALAALEPPGSAPRPANVWRFDGDARDSVGGLNAELIGGAAVRNGRLVLDGKGSFARTAPLRSDIREKTLEAWVIPANLTQRGGGVVTLETDGGGVFDSIVFAERQPGRWMAGSNFFRRTRDVGGPAEDAKPGEPAHVAAVYAANGSIALFRNGEPYGPPYTPAGDGADLQTYRTGAARLLFGLRHTGAGNGFFAGEIDEARLYDRPLSAAELKSSFRSGPGAAADAELDGRLSPADRDRRAKLRQEVAALREKLAATATADPWATALADADRDPGHPLRPWALLRDKPPTAVVSGWNQLAEKARTEVAERKRFNREAGGATWDLTRAGDVAKWYRTGPGLPATPSLPGEFIVPPTGPQAVTGIYPAGVYSHLRGPKLGGILTSPKFKLPPDAVSVRFLAGGGGGVRVIVDGYPLGFNGTYPQARPSRDEMGWQRLDTTYRAGSDGYLEFATFDDLTRPQGPDGKAARPDDGRSSFGVAQIKLGGPTPRDEVIPVLPLFAGPTPANRTELAARVGSTLKSALVAWRDETLTDEEAAFLDVFVRKGLLTNRADAVPAVAAYRAAEAAMAVPARVPGVLEAGGSDAPLFARGNHRTPGRTVPRGFLSALGGRVYRTPGSGRLDLAGDLVSPGNPLFPRVAVNRLWHWLFGRGLVPTPDNFGALGEPPTHPELLDWLAADFAEHGYSVKRTVRLMVTSEAFRMSSTAPPDAAKRDPANAIWTRARVRRLDAEAVRDSLLSMTGELDPAPFGPPTGGGPLDGGRRSVYLPVVRNSPHPFLEVFDKPAPATARGSRDVTTLPAQSLARMNSPLVSELSKRWGARLAAESATVEARIRRMFLAAVGRPPTADESRKAREYLGSAATDHGTTAADPRPWADLAHAVCGLTETVYLP